MASNDPTQEIEDLERVHMAYEIYEMSYQI
jgi:hypothetical protein